MTHSQSRATNPKRPPPGENIRRWGLFSQESKETNQQHRGICPPDSFHSSCRASLALGRVHVVSHSAEALGQAEGGQVDLQQTVSHGIMAYTSALSPTGFPAPASGACCWVGTWLRVTGNDCGIPGNACLHLLCTVDSAVGRQGRAWNVARKQ